MQLQAGRQLWTQFLLQLLLDLVDNGDRVGVGDLDDTEADGGVAIEACQLAEIGEAVFDFGDVGETDRCLPLPCDDHLLEVVQRMEFQIELDQILGAGADDEAASQLHMLLVECVGDILCGHAHGHHAIGQQIDADGPVAAAAKTNFADAIDGFEALLQCVDGVLV